MLGIIGGSGLYQLADIEEGEWQEVQTPWGEPSDAIFVGRLFGHSVAFLPRHGRGHTIPPGEINYRANIDALKRIGCSELLSFSACGSFRKSMKPGHFVLVEQFIDRTVGRKSSFFGRGCVGHVSLAHPVCRQRLGKRLEMAAKKAQITMHENATYLAIEGPQFSTLAESHLYRKKWGCDVIGMTNMPEARLAREAELCYASVAMVTDFDSWHPKHGEVDVAAIIAVMQGNTKKACELIKVFVKEYAAKGESVCPSGCDRSLEYAILTAPEKRDPELLAKLEIVAGRVLSR